VSIYYPLPAPLSVNDVTAQVYRTAHSLCHQKLDELPQLYEQGKISEAVYYASDAHLCRLADAFADCLNACGVSQPTRSR
jgi:hypothetical protein